MRNSALNYLIPDWSTAFLQMVETCAGRVAAVAAASAAGRTDRRQTDAVRLRSKLKRHCFDLLWICCTTCCTVNSQHVVRRIERLYAASPRRTNARNDVNKSVRCVDTIYEMLV